MDSAHAWRYYEEEFDLDRLCLDRQGFFDREFLEHYNRVVRKERQSFQRVKRILAENRIDENDMEMDYKLICGEAKNSWDWE